MEDKAPHCGVTHVSATTEPLQEKDEKEEEEKEKKTGSMCVEAERIRERRVNNVKSEEITVLGALAFQKGTRGQVHV